MNSDISMSAEAYRNEIIPLARGKAKQMLKSYAYKVKLINAAEVKHLDSLNYSTSIKRHPQSQKKIISRGCRISLSNSSKVMIDVEGGNNMMYLPLDQLINRNQSKINNNETLDQSLDSDTSIMDRINSNKNNFNLRKRDLYNE